MPVQQGADRRPAGHLPARRHRRADGFVRGAQAVGVIDAHDAPARDHSGEHDHARTGGEDPAAGRPGEVHTPVAGAVRAGRRVEGSGHVVRPGQRQAPQGDRGGEWCPCGGRDRRSLGHAGRRREGARRRRSGDQENGEDETEHGPSVGPSEAGRPRRRAICGRPGRLGKPGSGGAYADPAVRFRTGRLRAFSSARSGGQSPPRSRRATAGGVALRNARAGATRCPHQPRSAAPAVARKAEGLRPWQSSA
jgi:hypothetical protein